MTTGDDPGERIEEELAGLRPVGLSAGVVRRIGLKLEAPPVTGRAGRRSRAAAGLAGAAVAASVLVAVSWVGRTGSPPARPPVSGVGQAPGVEVRRPAGPPPTLAALRSALGVSSEAVEELLGRPTPASAAPPAPRAFGPARPAAAVEASLADLPL